MSFETKYNLSGELILLRFSEKVDLVEFEQSIKQSFKTCQNHWRWNLLTDLRLATMNLTSSDLYAISVALSKTFPNHSRLAWLINEHQLTPEDAQLIRKTSQVHNIQFEIHFNEPDALNWLANG